MPRSSFAALALVAACCASQFPGLTYAPARRLAQPLGVSDFQVSDIMRLYKDCDFKGDYYLVRQPLLAVGITEASLLRNSRYSLLSTSSMQVKPGAYTIKLYQKPNLSGRSYELKDWQVSCLPADWNDKVQSIGVTPCVIFYQDANFQTPLFTNTGHVESQPMPGNANDQVSAVRIPKGWTLTLFEHTNGKGRKLVLRNDVADLSKLNFNDLSSSFVANNPRIHAID